jgi:hypothetical protein
MSALSLTCGMFIVLLATLDVALMVGLKEEIDRLNDTWRTVWKEAMDVALGGHPKPASDGHLKTGQL